MFATKNSQIIAGLSAAVVVALLVTIGYHLAPTGSSLQTFFFALGGKMPNGFIQFIAFAGFFTAVFSLYAISQRLQYEQAAYATKLLPEAEQFLLYPEDVARIKLETIEAERHIGPHMLTDLIKQTATKFRSNNSPADALAITQTVSELQFKTLEKEFWLVGICQTLIPTFGFLGTVWGLASAILSLGSIQPVALAAAGTGTTSVPAAPAGQVALSASDIETLVDHMGMAFFATMLAIALSLIVVMLSKRLEAQVEEFHLGMKRYVVENLVNRIHL
ncbi:MAG: MotA/TolQ/ExbB proton channel family protein [Saprospiraceae bacterium]